MPTLNLTLSMVCFDDTPPHNNPRRRRPDWQRVFQGIPAFKPGMDEVTIDPLQEILVFSGVRSLGVGSGTEFALSNVPTLGSTRYRLQWTGVGAAPAFRTARTVASATGNLVMTLNANQTITVTSSLGAIFGAVVVGDQVFIPGVSTGDTSVFDPLNEGLWTVLVASGASVTLGRLGGTVFSGASETVAISDNAQFQVFSFAGVQVGDTLDLVAGFSAPALHAYEIELVTASRLEFISTEPLGSETVVPGASGLAVYSAAKKVVYIETDQEIALKYNGATDETNRVTPWVPGDDNNVGVEVKVGTVYSLSVKNRSTEVASVKFAFAE